MRQNVWLSEVIDCTSEQCEKKGVWTVRLFLLLAQVILLCSTAICRGEEAWYVWKDATGVDASRPFQPELGTLFRFDGQRIYIIEISANNRASLVDASEDAFLPDIVLKAGTTLLANDVTYSLTTSAEISDRTHVQELADSRRRLARLGQAQQAVRRVIDDQVNAIFQECREQELHLDATSSRMGKNEMIAEQKRHLQQERNQKTAAIRKSGKQKISKLEQESQLLSRHIKEGVDNVPAADRAALDNAMALADEREAVEEHSTLVRAGQRDLQRLHLREFHTLDLELPIFLERQLEMLSARHREEEKRLMADLVRLDERIVLLGKPLEQPHRMDPETYRLPEREAPEKPEIDPRDAFNAAMATWKIAEKKRQNDLDVVQQTRPGVAAAIQALRQEKNEQTAALHQRFKDRQTLLKTTGDAIFEDVQADRTDESTIRQRYDLIRQAAAHEEF